MSKVSGRTGPPGRIDQTRRPDARFLKKRAFEKQTLPEPPRLEKPRVYIFGRSPLRGFYYPKGARGKYHTADRVTRGTRWNAYLCSGTAIPKGTRPEVFIAPPAVNGLLSSMRAAQKMHHATEPLIHHTHHHVHSSHVFEPHPHTINSRSSLDTGWLDVPMPGALTEFQQGVFMHLNPVHHHSSHVPVMAGQPHAPTATISMQAVPMEFITAQPQATPITIHEPVQSVQGATYEYLSEARTPEVQQKTVHTPEVTGAVAYSEDGVPAPIQMIISSSKPARLHFDSVHAEKSEAKTDNNSPIAAKSTDSKAHEFSSEIPRSEELRASPEQPVQAVTRAAEIKTEQIRFGENPMPEHVGYIPSVRKKEKQLKVAQGAEGIPPQ